MNKRIYKYDVLRAICIYSIIILHLGSAYTGGTYDTVITKTDYNIGLFFDMMTRTAVPCFVMLSGAFLINNNSIDFFTFYWKMWKRIMIPTLIFSVIYVGYAYLQMVGASLLGLKVSAELTNPWRPLLWLIQGRPHIVMWYIFMLWGLYAVTPVINLVKREISVKSFYWLSIGMMIYGIAVCYTCELSWILQFVQWIGYYMLGYSIRDICENKVRFRNNRIVAIFFVGAGFLLQLMNYFFAVGGFVKKIDLQNSFQPIVVLSTLFLFVGFSLLEFKKEYKWISYIAQNTIFIYLLHILLIDPVFQICGRVLGKLPSAKYIILYGVVVLMMCLGGVELIRALQRRIHRHIERDDG